MLFLAPAARIAAFFTLTVLPPGQPLPHFSNPPAIAPQVADETARAYEDIWSRFPSDFNHSGFIDSESALPPFQAKANGDESTPWFTFAKLLKQQQPLIKELLANAERAECRFAPRKSGDDPQRSNRFRESSRVLCGDAGRLCAAGDVDGSIERLCAMYGLVDHASQQSDELYLLQAPVMLQYTNWAAQKLIANRQQAVTRQHAQRLLQALDRIDAEQLDRMLATEKQMLDLYSPETKTRVEATSERSRRVLSETRELLEAIARP